MLIASLPTELDLFQARYWRSEVGTATPPSLSRRHTQQRERAGCAKHHTAEYALNCSSWTVRTDSDLVQAHIVIRSHLVCCAAVVMSRDCPLFPLHALGNLPGCPRQRQCKLQLNCRKLAGCAACLLPSSPTTVLVPRSARRAPSFMPLSTEAAQSSPAADGCDVPASPPVVVLPVAPDADLDVRAVALVHDRTPARAEPGVQCATAVLAS